MDLFECLDKFLVISIESVFGNRMLKLIIGAALMVIGINGIFSASSLAGPDIALNGVIFVFSLVLVAGFMISIYDRKKK